MTSSACQFLLSYTLLFVVAVFCIRREPCQSHHSSITIQEGVSFLIQDILAKVVQSCLQRGIIVIQQCNPPTPFAVMMLCKGGIYVSLCMCV